MIQNLGRSGLWTRMGGHVFGRREWSGLGLGLVTLAAAIALDIIVSSAAVIVAGFVIAVFLPAAFGGRAATLVVALAVMMSIAVSPVWNTDVDMVELRIQLVLALVVCLVALHISRVRYQARLGTDQLDILKRLAVASSRTLAPEDTLRIVESIVVPAFADFYMIDRVFNDAAGGLVVERASVAVDSPYAAEFAPWLRERRSSVPIEMISESAAGQDDSVVLVSPVREEKLVEISHGAEDLETLRRLRMNSYMHVTLRARGELLGVLTMGVAWSGRRYNPDDAAFARVLAGRIALVLDNAGLFSHLRRIESRLDTAMAVLDEAVVIHERGGHLVFANQAAANLFQLDDPDRLIGVKEEEIRRWCRFYDEIGRPLDYASMGELRAVETYGHLPEIIRAEIGPERREIWLRPRVKSVVDTDGLPLFAVTALEDVTGIKRTELDQKLLGRSSELLAAADSYDDILRQIASVLVPMLADACAVDVVDFHGGWRRIVTVHGEAGGDTGILADGDSRMQLDLIVGGRRIGVVTVANDPGHLELTEEDRKIAVRFLERIGIALEKARLAADRAEIAESLQQGLVPPPLPVTPGWELAAIYRPAGELNEVGGDFYETFRTDRGRMVVIGDVVGRGARAASITAQARFTLRTAGQLSHDPTAALSVLNRALYGRDDSPLCSAVAVVLDDDGRHLDLMVAGHPPPFRVSEDSVEQIGENGPILGAFKDAHWPIQRISLEDDERLVLYTDGVTEAETGDGRFGEERLRDILMSGGSGTELLARLEGRLRDFVSEPTQDDVAALILGPDSREIGSSSTRVELIEHIYDAFNRRAIGELQDLCLPEVELEIPTAQIAGRGGIYQGYAGLAKYEQDLSRIWDDLLITPHWVADVDNWTIVKGRIFARSRGLGMRDLPVAWLWQLQDDRIVRGKTFLDLDRAFSFARSGVG